MKYIISFHSSNVLMVSLSIDCLNSLPVHLICDLNAQKFILKCAKTPYSVCIILVHLVLITIGIRISFINIPEIDMQLTYNELKEINIQMRQWTTISGDLENNQPNPRRTLRILGSR